MEKIYIAGTCRTPIGTLGGSLKTISASDLGAIVIKEAAARAGVDLEKTDQVLMGNVLQAGQGQNPARQAAVKAGVPIETPALTLNKVCGSGMSALNIAAALILAGQADCIAAGGMENMSQAPYLIKDMRFGHKMGNVETIDSMVYEGLWDVFNDYHMGITAENVAEKYGVTREMQDELALASQQKAADARDSGRFDEEIIAVEIPQRKGDPVLFEKDEHIRNTSADALAKLKPAFKKDGTVTAGNASGINDGAAAFFVMSEKFVKENNIKPEARWVGGASKGTDPAYMGIGPVGAVKKALEITGLSIDDINLIEANEAFAAQAVAVIREIGADTEKVNVNGGAIALGHPIGASGARITVSLINEMRRRNLKYGLATLCIGGGMGEAVIAERDEICR